MISLISAFFRTIQDQDLLDQSLVQEKDRSDRSWSKTVYALVHRQPAQPSGGRDVWQFSQTSRTYLFKNMKNPLFAPLSPPLCFTSSIAHLLFAPHHI